MTRSEKLGEPIKFPISTLKTKAIFLDRDGVLNDLAFNPANGEYESPHSRATLEVLESEISALKNVTDRYKIFIVSNQPSFAKGKTTMDDTHEVASAVMTELISQGIKIEKAYYCYHHPEALVPELKVRCGCRKPGTDFLLEAAAEFAVDLGSSWMIGDQDTDIQCGAGAGCRTILIENPRSAHRRKGVIPTYKAGNLTQAINLILRVESSV